MNFRKDLETKAATKIEVPRKKYMMCLNESSLNPWHVIGDKLKKRLETIGFNRYFNPITSELKLLLSNYVGVSEDRILMGNGADEMLYYLFTAVRESSNSFCVAPSPSYFDYKSYSSAVGMGIKTQDLQKDFQFDSDEFLELTNADDCSLAIICNPNNPTGNLISKNIIFKILDNCTKPVLIDETYFEFSGVTFKDYLEQYPNLIIIRSFSKAFSSAGLRFGYLISSKENISEIKKVMTVFNLGLVTQAIAAEILLNKEIFLNHNEKVKDERTRIYNIINKKRGYKIYPSNTNFLIFSCGEKTINLFNFLSDKEIALRNVGSHPLLRNHIRLTVSTEEENNRFLNALAEFEQQK